MTSISTSELTHIISTTSYLDQHQTFNYYATLYSEERDIRILKKTIITIRRYVSILINIL